MELIASHPIDGNALIPHYGRPVMAVTHDGQQHAGVIQSVGDGHLYLMPMDGFASAAVRNAARKLPKVKSKAQGKRVSGSKHQVKKAKVNFFRPFFNPFFFTLPLFALASVFAFPFFI